MTWFKKLTGFAEQSPEQVRANIIVTDNILKSQVNQQTMTYGLLEIPSLAELQQRLSKQTLPLGKMTLREVVADVQQLHVDKANANALFQVASQFNLLEMAAPDVTPESGVGIYEYDRTQGPACAIAAGAGTIYRNYFAPVNGQIGQSATNQIDCLADIGIMLGNTDNCLWEMKNGYALATENGLQTIAQYLEAATADELDTLRQQLRIGLQWNTEVTIADPLQFVSQAYCAALPIAYSKYPPQLWAPFAQLILEASYEAVLCAGILNAINNNNKQVFLTLIGGGVFGNHEDWILNAIKRALIRYAQVELDVAIVSYGRTKKSVQNLVNQLLTI